MGEPAVQLSQTSLQVLEADIDPDVLPKPALWKLLIKPIKIEEATASGIVFAAETQRAQEHLRYVGRVIAVGPGAYKHQKFDGITPACAPGDWIIYNTFSGLDVRVTDRKGAPVTLRLINDDEVQAIAPSPEALLVNF